MVPETGDVDTGIALADSEIERGTDLLIVAAPGVRPTPPSRSSVLTNTEPVKVLSRGAAATDRSPGWTWRRSPRRPAALPGTPRRRGCPAGRARVGRMSVVAASCCALRPAAHR